MFINRGSLRSYLIFALASLALLFASRQAEAQNYSVVPFAFNSKSLPAHYMGHDAQRVYTAIQNKRGLVKGEYETSTEFAKRFADAQVKVLYGGMHLSDVYAFSLSHGSEGYDNNAFSVTYDADGGKLNVSPTFDCSDDIGAAFEARSKIDEAGKYSGTNAFGVARTVNRVRDTVYDVVVDNVDDFDTQPTGISARKIVIRLPISPTTARKIRSSVRVIAVCTLSSSDGSGTTTKVYEQTPTLDNPTDSQTTKHYILATVKEFIVFDQSTGSVFSIIKAKSSTNDTIPQTPDDDAPLTPLEKANLRKFHDLMNKP